MAKTKTPKASAELVELVGEDMAEMLMFMNPDMILNLAELALWKDPADQQYQIESLGLGTRLCFKTLKLIEERNNFQTGMHYIVTDKFQPVAEAAKKIIEYLQIHQQIRRFVDG